MIHTYPELTKEQIDRQGKTFVFCDHQDVEPAVWEGATYVTSSDVGKPKPPELVSDSSEPNWEVRDIGRNLTRGTLVKEAVEGDRCTASAELEIEERPFQEGNRRGVELFAPVPEGWASSSSNALDGAADFCPNHADRIYVPPADADVPPPIVDTSDEQPAETPEPAAAPE